MRVAYYFEDYPDCNLTDLNSLKECKKGYGVLTHFCQLMFEPIEMVGLSRKILTVNHSTSTGLNPNLQAVVDGLVDTSINQAYRIPPNNFPFGSMPKAEP